MKRKRRKRRRRLKWKNIIIALIFVVFLVVMVIGIYNLIRWKINSSKTNKQINDVKGETEVLEVKDNEKTEVIENEEIDEDDLYWEYIKMNLIDVDFKELKKKNKETVGWIKVLGTNINYPFVQTDNNSYYLNHSFDKSYNSAGWVFLDYRNKLEKETDKNTILYAHGRLDKTMFGSLKNILSSNWLNDSNNYVVKLSTEYENTLWQVFSVYHIPTTSDYIQTVFESKQEYKKFLEMLLKRSSYDFKTSIKDSDRILTLSTCYNDKERVVLHAKLIKREKK